VFFQCRACRRIHSSRPAARDCCKPIVGELRDEQVALCCDGGRDCQDTECLFCQGTGLMMRPPERIKP
jgi:hypothetical protein